MRMLMLAIYVCGMLVSGYVLSGECFAEFEQRFNDPELFELTSSTLQSRQNLGFALSWGALGSLVWPITLPFTYVSSGFAPFGIWRDYTIARVSTPTPPTKWSDKRRQARQAR